jgi:hypothetical protein
MPHWKILVYKSVQLEVTMLDASVNIYSYEPWYQVLKRRNESHNLLIQDAKLVHLHTCKHDLKILVQVLLLHYID